MKKNILRSAAILGLGIISLSSCSKSQPPLVYFPDMYFPVAYDPLMKAEDPYSDHENDIPAFVKQDGGTALAPVTGTVSQNKEGIVEENPFPMTVDQYNAGYDASKTQTVSPLNPANEVKDLERGKAMYERTCAACHGVAGDGQGPIVASGAYAGVPKYADREITVGSVHYVLTNGRNAMGSYAGQLKPGDRWRVAMYVMHAFKNQVAVPAAVPAKDSAKVSPAQEAVAKAVSTSTTPKK